MVGIGWQLACCLPPITLSCWISSAGAECSSRWAAAHTVSLPFAAAWGARRVYQRYPQSPNRSPSRPVSGCCLLTARHLEGQCRDPRIPLLGTGYWLLHGLMIWMPSYLSSSLVFSLSPNQDSGPVTVVGMTFGIWLFGACFGGRVSAPAGRSFLIYPRVGAVVMVIIYAQLRDITTLMLFTGAVMGMFVNGMIGGYGALISDTYPLQVRAYGAERAV